MSGGNCFSIMLSYSPSAASRNHKRPLVIGPENVKRGFTLSKMGPFLFCTEGMKSVTAKRKWSSPVAVFNLSNPPEFFSYSAEKRRGSKMIQAERSVGTRRRRFPFG